MKTLMRHERGDRIAKVKIVKNPSLFLYQCTFTMLKPRVHNVSQWQSKSIHNIVSFLISSKKLAIVIWILYFFLQVKALFNLARNDYGGVHILVNNAGLSHASPLLSGNPKDFKNMCDINIVGLTG